MVLFQPELPGATLPFNLMIYLLDTDTIIYWLNGNQIIEQRALRVGITNLSYSIISHAELSFGAHNSKKVEQNLKNVDHVSKILILLHFDKDSANTFGEIKASLKQQGLLILDADIMIASIALTNKLILVTNNRNHFDRIPNLTIENWLA